MKGQEKINSALSHKPNLEDLESSEEDVLEKESEGAKYKVPKVAPSYYYEPGLSLFSFLISFSY